MIFEYLHSCLFVMVPQTVEMRIILRSVTLQFVLKGTHAVKRM